MFPITRTSSPSSKSAKLSCSASGKTTLQCSSVQCKVVLPDALQLNFADLDDGLDVRVIGNIAHDFLRVRPKSGLKRFHRIELQLSDRQIGSGRAGRRAGDSMLYGDALERWSQQPAYQRDMCVAVVADVKIAARGVRIHDGDFDHGLPRSFFP